MEVNYNSQSELEDRYIEEEIECESKSTAQKDIYGYLGNFAAEAEWNTNPEEANKRFLNVDAYKKFRGEYYTGLVGRTGTGKTSIISMYRDSIPQLLQICCDVLSGKRYCFTAKEFNGYIRSVKKIYKEGLKTDEIRRVLIESGLVGIEDHMSFIPEDSKWFQNEKVIRIVSALFEYQMKGRLV